MMKKLLLLFLLVQAIQASATRWYFTQNGAGNQNGLSWANAKSGRGLEAFLNSSVAPFDTIWVAAGTYYTDTNATASPLYSNYLKSFGVRDSAALYGGFAGTETSLAQRNIAANPTILSGNCGRDGIASNNARHVVSLYRNSTIDGFIIQDGYADGAPFSGNGNYPNINPNYHSVGAGLFVYHTGVYSATSSPNQVRVTQSTNTTAVIANCIIRNNSCKGSYWAAGAGAAVFSSWGNTADVSFNNCRFVNNDAVMNGGAIYATSSRSFPFSSSFTNMTPDSAHGNLTLRINNCQIDSNTSPTNSGAGIYFDVTPTLTNVKPRIKAYIDNSTFNRNTGGSNACLFISTTAGNRSGFDSLRITNSTFSNNYCLSQSGASSVLGVLFSSNDTSALFNYYFYNVNFTNNINTQWGTSGVFVTYHAGADRGVIRKCNFINNKSSFGAACLNFTVGNSSTFPQAYRSSLLIDSCVFRNNSDSIGGANGMGAMDLLFWNPTDTFVIQNTTISNNRGGTATAYFRNRGAIKIINCTIDSNCSNPSNITSPIIFDGSILKYSLVSNCRFNSNNYLPTTNSSQSQSGTLYYFGSPVDTINHHVTNSQFLNNKGGYYGGAIQTTGGSGFVRLSLRNSVFQGNTATGNGGAIACVNPPNSSKRGELLVYNCLITGNKSEYSGAGIYYGDYEGKVTMYNSTIASNYVSSPGYSGAGLIINTASGSSDTSRIYNSIIWGNVANGNAHAEVTPTGFGQVKIKLFNSIVKDGFNPQLYSQDLNISWQNLLNYNPLFNNLPNATTAPHTNGDFKLQFCSPAVNRGDNNRVSWSNDLNDSARIKQGTVDLGCYESNHNNGLEIPVAYTTNYKACELTSLQLLSLGVSGAASLNWVGPKGFTSTIPNPKTPAPDHIGIFDSTEIYTLTANYANGCSLSDTVGVVVTPAPKVDITNNDTSMCTGSYAVSLNATYQQAINPPVFQWYKDSLTNTVASTTLPYVTNLTGKVKMYLRVTEPQNQCNVVDSVLIQVGNAKQLAPTISGNNTLCEGDTIKLNASNVSNASYRWSGPSGFTASTQNIQRANATPAMAGVYGVYAIKNGAVSGCDTSATESTNVVINTRPASQSLNVSRSLTFCGNDSVILSTTNTAGHKYRWLKNGINTGNNADTLFGLIVKTSGTYNVRVTNTNGCANTMRDTVVTANPKPNTSTITGSASVQVNSSQNYSVSNTAGSTYNWSVQLGTQTTGGNTNAIGVTWGASSGTGTVKVIETNSSGCKGDTVSKAVTINAIVADSLTLGNDTVKFVSTGGTKNVTLNSNRSWAVSNTAGWLSISPMSGSNNGTLQLTATSNTGAQRSTTVSVTAGSNTKTIVVVQDGFVGLEEAEREKTIQVYPNPTEGKVTISGVSAAQHITIRMMDMTGKILSEEKCMDGTTLDYSNYANGIYLLQLNKADKISYIKLWIAHP